MWGLLLLALLFTGCSSGDGADTGGRDFVFTGGGIADGGTPGPGAVTFNFVKAQTALTVPTDTTQIRFKFFTAGNVLIQTNTADFAPSITIDPVDARAASVTITAIGPNGFPLATATVPVQVVSGETVEVDFDDISMTPVTLETVLINPPSATLAVGDTQQFTANFRFSNGDILPGNGVTWSATGQVSVDANGLATGTTDGEGTVTADINGTQGSATIVVGQGFFLDSVLISPGGMPVVASNGGTLEFTVEGLDQFGNPFPITGTVNWAITTNNTGSTIDQNGLYTAGAVEDTDTVTVTVDGTLTDTQDVTVTDIPGDITMIELTPDPVNMTAAFQTQVLTATGTFEDMTTAPLTNAQHGVTYVSSNPAAASVNAVTGVVTAQAQGTTTITVSTMSGGMLVSDDTDVNVDFGAANAAPVVTPDAAPLTVDLTPVPAYPGITVTDDQVSLVGGTVTLSVLGAANDLIYDVDEGSAIIEMGTLVGDGTSTVTFDIAADVTPAQLTTFLQGVTVARNALSGTATLQVSVSDGRTPNERTGTGSRAANAFITVGAMNGDFADLATALMNVNNTNATIAVEPNHTDMAAFAIDSGSNHDGLRIQGAGQGISAGVTQILVRPDPGSLSGGGIISALNVTLDGLDFDTNPVSVSPGSNNLTVTNCRFSNISSIISALSVGSSTGLSVTNCGFENNDFGLDLVGTMVSEFPGGVITGNAFVGNTEGLFVFFGNGSQTILGNGFSNQTSTHLRTQLNTGVTVTASGNEFKSDSGVVSAEVDGTLNAQSNFWGVGTTPPATPAQFTATGAATIDVSNPLFTDPFPGF